MAGTRFLVAGLLLAGFVRLRGIAMPDRQSWPSYALLGVLLVGCGNGALVWAEQFVPSGAASVMVATIPFWMLGVEALLPSGERIRPRQCAGLVLGFAGLVLLAGSNLEPPGTTARQFLSGVIAVQFSCFGWALGSAYSKRHARHESAVAAAALQMIFGGVALILAGTVLGEWHAVHNVTMRSAIAYVYLIVFGSLVGYVSYIYALKYLPVATVSLYAYITPVLAVILGAVVMSEPFTPTMALAIAIIFAGMLVVRQNADTLRS